jgi:hypothetical protein
MNPSQGEEFRYWAFLAQRDYTFFASEDLYGLDGIKPPGR